MIIIVAKSQLKEGKRDEYYVMAREMEEKSRKEKGCASYTLYEDMNDSMSVCFIEEWEDQAAIDAHNQSPHFTHFIPLMNELRISSEVTKYHKA